MCMSDKLPGDAQTAVCRPRFENHGPRSFDKCLSLKMYLGQKEEMVCTKTTKKTHRFAPNGEVK